MSSSFEDVPEHRGRIIRSEIATPVSAWQAWLAWKDLSHLSNWLLDDAKGEFAVGQRLSWSETSNFSDTESEIKLVEDGRRLVAQLLPSGQLMEVVIEGTTGSSLVSITHSGFPDEAKGDADYQRVISAWHIRVNVLKLYLTHYFGRSRRTLRSHHDCEIPLDDLRANLRPPGRAGWLVQEGAFSAERESRLMLWDGTLMTAKVLAAHAESLMLAWREINGYLLLRWRALDPTSTEVTVDVTSWGGQSDLFEAAAETICIAVSKLARLPDVGVRSQGSGE